MSQESKKPKLFSDQSFSLFQEKTELKYLEKIDSLSNELNFSRLTLRNEKHHKEKIAEKIEKELECQNIKKTENSEKIQALNDKETLIMESIYQLEKDYEKQENDLIIEGKSLDELNKKLNANINDKDREIRIKDRKIEGFLAEIFDLQCSVNQKEKKKEEEKQQKMCCVCLLQQSTYVFYPCGHKKFCEKCILKLDTCPLCKKLVYMKAKIFD